MNHANPLLAHPRPDFTELARVLKGEAAPRRVHLAELTIDAEILEAICARYGAGPWLPNATGEAYLRQHVEMYYRLGYDYVPVWPEWQGHPDLVRRRTQDTALLARPERGGSTKDGA